MSNLLIKIYLRVQDEFAYEILQQIVELGHCRKLLKTKQAIMGHNYTKHTVKFSFDLREKCFESISKLDRYKMTHNVEKSFTSKKYGKKFLKFLPKDSMLQHVKKIH